MIVRTGFGACTRALVIVMVLVGLVPAGCGRKSSGSTTMPAAPGAACQQVGSVNFDKTKFVLHAGLGFGAFHHFIYAPYQADALHGIVPPGKAGLAALFSVHEMKLAKAEASRQWVRSVMIDEECRPSSRSLTTPINQP